MYVMSQYRPRGAGGGGGGVLVSKLYEYMPPPLLRIGFSNSFVWDWLQKSESFGLLTGYHLPVN